MAEVEYRIASTREGTTLLADSAPVVGGTWGEAVTLPPGVTAGATWWLGQRAVDGTRIGAWQWTSHLLEAVAALTRQTMVYGVDKPVPGTLTGVPAGTVLTDTADTTTPLYVTTTGAVYRRVRFRRRVVIQARGVRFYECEFTGGPTVHTTDHGLLTVTDAALAGSTDEERTKVYDSTFRPRALGDRVNGFLGWHTDFYRCDFSRVVDAFNVHGFNWWSANGRPTSYPVGFRAHGCSWHDLYFAATTTQPDGWTHNDGVQVQGGDGGHVLGCWGVARRDPAVGHQGDVVGTGGAASYLGGRVLSNVLFSPNVGVPNGWVVEKSWLDGGHLSVQIDPAVTVLEVTGHRFDGTSSGRDINSDALAADRPGVITTGNTRPGGAAPNIRRGDQAATPPPADVTPPTTTVASPGAGSTTQRNVTVQGTYDDPSAAGPDTTAPATALATPTAGSTTGRSLTAEGTYADA